MAFVKEELTKEDQQKILRDIQYDEKKYALLKKNLEYYGRRPNFPYDWVIDHSSGFYLLYVSKNAHYLEPDRYFYFYDKAYEVLVKNAFIGVLSLIDLPEHALLEEFKENLRKAFPVYGEYREEDVKKYFPIFEIELENKGEC